MRAPAFQFYAGDWLADEAITCMTLAQEGCYIRLLAICWREGSIPVDEEKLKLLCKGGSTDDLNLVKQMFKPSPVNSDRLVHPMLEAEREKQASWREKSVEGGLKSAEKRKMAKNINGGGVVVDTVAARVVEGWLQNGSNQSPTLQSSSSISSSDKTKDSCPSGDGRVSVPVEASQLVLVSPEPVIDFVGDWFSKFWKAYPKKKGMGAAEVKFREVVKKQAMFDTVMAALEAQKLDPANEKKQFWPEASRWLKEKRWLDEVAPVAPAAPAAAPAAASVVIDSAYWKTNFPHFTLNLCVEREVANPAWWDTDEAKHYQRWLDWLDEEDRRRAGRSSGSRSGPFDPGQFRAYSGPDDDDIYQRPAGPERKSGMTSMGDAAASLLAKIQGGVA